MYRCVDAAAITLVHTPMPPAARSGAAGGGAAGAAATSGLIRLLPWRLGQARQLTASWLLAATGTIGREKDSLRAAPCLRAGQVVCD